LRGFRFKAGDQPCASKRVNILITTTHTQEGRTKGKAAIAVVGSQAGKSAGSMLQQLLLLVSAGAITGSLPIMFVVYGGMAVGWLRSVTQVGAFCAMCALCTPQPHKQEHAHKHARAPTPCVVTQLSEHNPRYGHPESVHASLTAANGQEEDSDWEGEAEAEGGGEEHAEGSAGVHVPAGAAVPV
jgi:hypothetical protein